MSVRKIYLHPGDMIDLRFCHPSDEKSAAAWRDQLSPPNVLIRAFPDRLTCADPAVTFDTNFCTPETGSE